MPRCSQKNYGVHWDEPVSLDLDAQVTFFIPTHKTYGYSFHAPHFSVNFLFLLNNLNRLILSNLQPILTINN